MANDSTLIRTGQLIQVPDSTEGCLLHENTEEQQVESRRFKKRDMKPEEASQHLPNEERVLAYFCTPPIPTSRQI